MCSSDVVLATDIVEEVAEETSALVRTNDPWRNARLGDFIVVYQLDLGVDFMSPLQGFQ